MQGRYQHICSVSIMEWGLQAIGVFAVHGGNTNNTTVTLTVALVPTQDIVVDYIRRDL